METNRFRQFLTVANTHNLRKAAELLGMSHGALSKSMKVLQEELGMALLQPAGRGIEVTGEGRRLALKLPKILAELDSLKQEKITEVPPVRLATFEVFSTYFMDPLVRTLQASLGNTLSMQCRETGPGELERSVLEEEADFGLTYLPIPRPGIRFEKVARIEMAIFARVGAFARTALDQIPFAVPMIPVQGAPSGVKGLDGWPDHLFARKIGFEVELMETALALCRAGLAAAFLPRFIARLHNEQVRSQFQLHAHPLPAGIALVKRDVYVVARSQEPETKIEKILCKAIRQYTR